MFLDTGDHTQFVIYVSLQIILVLNILTVGQQDLILLSVNLIKQKMEPHMICPSVYTPNCN